MIIKIERRDPMPNAERGTMEYAASAAACHDVLVIELTADEVAQLFAAIENNTKRKGGVLWELHDKLVNA